MRLRIGVALGLCLSVGAFVFGSVAEAAPSEHPFELVPGSFHFVPSTYQAGAHSDWTTSFGFMPEGEAGLTFGDARNITVELPAGFDASNTAAPACTQAQLLGINKTGQGNLPECPLSSQIGTITLELFVGTKNHVLYTSPLYNMEVTSFGTTAELGYKTVIFTGLLQIGVRSADIGLTSQTTNIPKQGEVRKVSVTVWGIPAAHSHDAMRGATCGVNDEFPPVCHNEYGSPQPANIPVKPFLANPTKCGMFEAKMQADSWEEPFNWQYASDQVGPIAECERVQFEPEIEAQPSTLSAESPSGLEVSLVVPQTWENQFTIATSYLKGTKVTLPEGMTANPGLAEGLGSCTREQYERETSSSLPGEGCPPESKIGSITIETPLLAESIPGSIYIATPYDNVPAFGDAEHPGGSLLALYVVGKDPQRGILLKVAGKIEPNPVTGQLVTTFERQPGVNGGPEQEGLPQQPFSKFTLKFRPGATAPLISPPRCGSYAINGVLTPWSAPEEPSIISSQPFQITQGVGGGACPTGGIPPFKPQVVSGTVNNAGGSYSHFYLRILREDGEQELVKFSTIFPPGVTGNLTGIPFCPDSSIEAAKHNAGAAELEHPSCPAASEIGHTIVGAGVGAVLAQNPGKVYLAGPYHGAPLSVVSITSAKVGPFDLGTVVIRFALDINPITAQVEISGASSDPIPHIIKGIVVHVRDIRVFIDRPNFMINPTNCEKLGITDQITGSGANYANPVGQDTVNVSTPFEAADCASLGFKPLFKASTSGKNSRKDGASLSVRLAMPGAQGANANIRSVKVDLPKQLPSRLTTLQKACTAATFAANPAACPAQSRVGQAKAITPVLPVPLEGPAYFVSYGGAKFPELVIVLQGYGFTIDLHGETFIDKAGITSSTFHAIPDEPVGSFELTLPQGADSALAANGSFCPRTTTVRKRVHGKIRTLHKSVAVKLVMPTAFTAQNGMTIHQNTPIGVTGCPKRRQAKTTKAGHRGAHGHR
jgi:hypothetical protein